MKRICVIGAGRFGAALAESLSRRGADVLLIDRNRDLVQRMSGSVTKAVQGDATDLRVLVEAGARDCDVAVVGIGADIEGSILAAMNLKELKIPQVIAKAGTNTHGRVLERIGVDLVLYPDRERAERLARSILSHSAVDFYEVLEGVSVVELPAPAKFAGKTLVEAEIRRTYGLTVLAIKRKGGAKGGAKNVISPSGDDVINEGDTLILFGPDRKLEGL